MPNVVIGLCTVNAGSSAEPTPAYPLPVPRVTHSAPTRQGKSGARREVPTPATRRYAFRPATRTGVSLVVHAVLAERRCLFWVSAEKAIRNVAHPWHHWLLAGDGTVHDADVYLYVGVRFRNKADRRLRGRRRGHAGTRRRR